MKLAHLLSAKREFDEAYEDPFPQGTKVCPECPGVPADVKAWALDLLRRGEKMPDFRTLDVNWLLHMVESNTTPQWILWRAQAEIERRLLE